MGGVDVLPWGWFLLGPFAGLRTLDKAYTGDEIKMRDHVCPDCGKRMGITAPPLFFTARYRRGRWEVSAHSLPEIHPDLANVLKLEDRRKA